MVRRLRIGREIERAVERREAAQALLAGHGEIETVVAVSDFEHAAAGIDLHQTVERAGGRFGHVETAATRLKIRSLAEEMRNHRRGLAIGIEHAERVAQ